MSSQAERVAQRFLADLHPPLGDPGGPCQVIERIDKAIHSPGLKDDLIKDVNHGEDLANSDAAKIYPLTREHGVGPIKQVQITSHGQYRMDLRGITVEDVRRTIGTLLQQMGMWKQKKHPAYERMNSALERGEKIEWVNPKNSLKIVLAPTGGGSVNLISAFWQGKPDPPAPHGKCEVPRHAADEKLAERVATKFLGLIASDPGGREGMAAKMPFNFTLFIKHRSGAMHNLGTHKTGKLWREIMAGRGGPEVTALAEQGYLGFLDDNGEVSDFEALEDHFKRHGGV